MVVVNTAVIPITKPVRDECFNIELF